MYWDDEAYLLSKINYNENSVIVEVFTQNHGKCSGIIYGGTSRKIKKYLQIGNKISISSKSKKRGKIDYFSIEPILAVSAEYFNNKEKIFCISSAASILKMILPEQQVNKKIYNSFSELIESFKTEEWIMAYIYWEQLLVKELGYGIDLLEKRDSKILINGVQYAIPKLFFLDKNIVASKEQINEALKFNKQLLVSSFLDGKSNKIPSYRSILEKYFN